MTDTSHQARLLETDEAKARPRRTTSKRANDLDGATWTRYSISIWDDIRKTPEEMALKHPAMFPMQLASRAIQCFTTNEERMILDPFVGIGSTVMAAEASGKVGIGFDVSEEFLRKARNRPVAHDLFNGVAGYAAGERRLFLANALDLLDYVEPETIDFVFTSPPYWDILLQDRTADYKETRHYGDDERDLGKIRDYGAFLIALAAIFDKVYKALKPGKYCCVVVMDLRKKDRFFPFHSDLAARLQEVGFIFDDLIIWDRGHEYNNLRPLGHPAVFRVNKVHEYVLIFKKPNSVGSRTS